MMEEDRNNAYNRAVYALIDVPGPRRGSCCPFPPNMDGLLPDLTAWGGDGERSLGPMLGRIDGEVERFSGGALKAQLNWCNKSENATTDIKI